jgi:hypothetical protein
LRRRERLQRSPYASRSARRRRRAVVGSAPCTPKISATRLATRCRISTRKDLDCSAAKFPCNVPATGSGHQFKETAPHESARRIPKTCSRLHADGQVCARPIEQGHVESDGREMASMCRIGQKAKLIGALHSGEAIAETHPQLVSPLSTKIG